MFQVTVGTYIAKKKFDVALRIENKYEHKCFTNDNAGFEAFIAWLLTFMPIRPLACREATDAYSLPWADFLGRLGSAEPIDSAQASTSSARTESISYRSA